MSNNCSPKTCNFKGFGLLLKYILYSDSTTTIASLLSIAQQLGERLANTSLTWQFLSKEKNDDYITIQLIPYKHLEDSLTGWYGVLRSFIGSKSKIYCGIRGNKYTTVLRVSVPKHLLSTLEASLSVNINNVDIKIIENNSTQGLQYLQCNDSADSFYHDQDFKKDGFYIDPFMDVVSLFEQLESNSLEMVYCFDYNASKKASFMKKVGGMFLNNIVKPIIGMESKSADKDSGEREAMTLGCRVGYRIQHNEPHLTLSIQSTFSKYTAKGLRKRSPVLQTTQLQLSQIINLFHLPSGKIIDSMQYLAFRKLQFPNNVPTLENTQNKNDITIIGKTEYRNQAVTFGITREDKLRHMYIIGKTGVGKSNLIANLARSDMVSNKGICVIDPHGDLIDDIIGQVPSYRINDVVLFDVADRDFPVGFNVLEHDKPEEKPLIASGIISIFKKLFGFSWGPRLEYILRNTLLAILEYPNATLMHVLRMLTDDDFRKDVLEYVKDPLILNFWKDEFGSRPQKQREESISPISNKIGQFTSSSIIRNIFGQSKSKINFRKLMDEGKIVLVNLSKGKIGEDNTNLLGSFIVSKIQIDAMSRADMEEEKRKDFYLYIDEFQNFATESFATILSEARKYKLGLILANQYSSQLDEVTRGAIFGNVGTMISMTLGYDDAIIMANQFKGMVSANDFLDIPKFKAYIKLMVHGIVSDPFNFQTIALPPGDDVIALKEKIREQSRNRYATGRTELEDLIRVWAERSYSKTEKAILKAKENNSNNVVREVIPRPAVSPVVQGTVVAPPKIKETPPSSGASPKPEVSTPTTESPIITTPKVEEKKEEVASPQVSKPEVSTPPSQEQPTVPAPAPAPQESKEAVPEEVIETPLNSGAVSGSVVSEPSEHGTISEYAGIKVGKVYEGYVKLKYNYGVFVTVGELDGLLHKSLIDCPEELSWKKLYEIGDPIVVKAQEIKELNGRITVVWTQL